MISQLPSIYDNGIVTAIICIFMLIVAGIFSCGGALSILIVGIRLGIL